MSSKINNEPAQAGSAEYYNLQAEMVEMHYDNISVTWEDGLSLKKAEKMLRERATMDTDTSINDDQQQVAGRFLLLAKGDDTSTYDDQQQVGGRCLLSVMQ